MQKEITFSTFIRWAGIVLLIGAVLGALNYLSDVLMPFFVAWLFAYLLYPIVKFIENRLHIRFRPVSIILTLLFVASIFALIGYLIVPPMIEQFQKLYDILIHWLRETSHNNDLSAWLSKKINENQEQITNFFKSRDFRETLKTTAPKLFNFIGQTASVLISIVASMITLLYTFFILLDYEYLTTNWIRIFPKKSATFLEWA